MKVNKTLIVGIMVGIMIPFLVAIMLPHSESFIPPTLAFSKILSGGQTINATDYHSNFTINTQGSITTSISQNTLNIKLVQKSCNPGEAFTAIGANGTLLCSIIPAIP